MQVETEHYVYNENGKLINSFANSRWYDTANRHNGA